MAALLLRVGVPAVVQLGTVDGQFDRRRRWTTWCCWHGGLASTSAAEGILATFADAGVRFPDQIAGSAVQFPTQTADASVVEAAAFVLRIRVVAIVFFAAVEVDRWQSRRLGLQFRLGGLTSDCLLRR